MSKCNVSNERSDTAAVTIVPPMTAAPNEANGAVFPKNHEFLAIPRVPFSFPVVDSFGPGR